MLRALAVVNYALACANVLAILTASSSGSWLMVFQMAYALVFVINGIVLWHLSDHPPGRFRRMIGLWLDAKENALAERAKRSADS